jgi:predicted permease
MRYLLNRRRLDQELAAEMEAHREMAAQDAVPFGNSLRLREEARDAWGWTWIEHLSQDLSYGFRQLLRAPGFTLAATLMLAIGIGVNVAAFGFFNLMVLRPLPVREPATILRFKRHAPQSFAYQVPYPEMAFFRDYSKTLSAIMGVHESKVFITGESKPLTASFVTSNVFDELGAVPALGGVIRPTEDSPVAVISYVFWQSHFAASPSIVGQVIQLNHKPVTVVGVASSQFSGLTVDDPQLWLPIMQEPYLFPGSHLLTDWSADAPGVTMFGRLKPGIGAAAAETELSLLAAQLRKQHPDDIWKDESLLSFPGAFAKNLSGGRHGTGTEAPDEAYPIIGLAGAMVLLILGVSCANLGSLLLARGVAREREIKIRTSVGAGSNRLIRQLFTEGLLLALLGSAAGLSLGYFVLRFMMIISKAPAWLNPAPDWRVAVFAVGIGFISSILFGLTPAIQIVRQRHRTTRLRHFLITAQIAASCVLVIVSGLLVRALHHALTISPGFEYQEIISIDAGLAAHGYSPAKARIYLDTLQNRLRGTPGIQSVSMSSSPPLGNKKVTTGADIAGRSVDVHMYGVDPQFFTTMKIPMLRGRNLLPSDSHALIISRSLAVQWPTGDPLGRPFQMGDSSFNVVGVCGSARLVAIQDSEAVEAYYLAPESELPSMVVLLRASGQPEGLLPFVSSVASSIDPQIMPEVQLMKTSFQRKMEASQYAAMTVTTLGVVALLLASLGIVGLVSYSISQRTKEIGIRMALGAKPAQILSIVVRQLTTPIVIGLIFGLGSAAFISQLLRKQLFGISNLDPLTYVASITFFAAAIFVAALLPARRALRIDPSHSLRYE